MNDGILNDLSLVCRFFVGVMRCSYEGICHGSKIRVLRVDTMGMKVS